jgi:hypothetical protein
VSHSASTLTKQETQDGSHRAHSTIERQYLIAQPGQIACIADLVPDDYGAILGAWPGPSAGQRFILAAEFDGALTSRLPPSTPHFPHD